jgi:hypothetical protein
VQEERALSKDRPAESVLTLGLALAFGTYVAARAALVGPEVDADALRDLFAALDIARHGSFYADGPAVTLIGSEFHLGPAYYYLLALPLRLWNGAQAIPWWVGLWQATTLLVLFDTARRLFSRRTALVATALFFLSWTAYHSAGLY